MDDERRTVWRARLAGAMALLALGCGAAGAQMAAPWRDAGTLALPPGGTVGPLTVSPGGGLVAGTVLQPGGATGSLWRIEDGRQLASFAGAFPLLVPMRFAGDPSLSASARLFSFSRDGLRLWTPGGGPPIRDIPFGPDVRINDVIHDPVRDTYLLSQDMGPILVLDSDGQTGARIETDALRPHRSLWLADGGSRLIVHSEAFTLTAPMRGLPTGCRPDSCAPAYEALPGSYGPYEETIAVDILNGRLATQPPVDPARVGQQDGVFRPVAVPSIRVWNPIEDWSPPDLPLAELALDQTPVWAEFSADGRHLVAVTTHGTLMLWSVDSGTRTMTIANLPDDWITAARFVPASKTLYVSTGRGRALLVRIGDGAVLQEFPAPNSEVVFAPDGRTMITAGLGVAPVRLWQR